MRSEALSFREEGEAPVQGAALTLVGMLEAGLKSCDGSILFQVWTGEDAPDARRLQGLTTAQKKAKKKAARAARDKNKAAKNAKIAAKRKEAASKMNPRPRSP